MLSASLNKTFPSLCIYNFIGLLKWSRNMKWASSLESISKARWDVRLGKTLSVVRMKVGGFCGTGSGHYRGPSPQHVVTTSAGCCKDTTVCFFSLAGNRPLTDRRTTEMCAKQSLNDLSNHELPPFLLRVKSVV